MIFEILGIIFIAWILLSSKRSRADGKLIKDVLPYRKLLLFASPGRHESSVYYDFSVNCENLEKILKKNKDGQKAKLINYILFAAKLALEKNPELNVFCSGNRLYKRNGVHATFTIKNDLQKKESKVSVRKLNLSKLGTFEEFCKKTNESVSFERSSKEGHGEKKFKFFASLPKFILLPVVKFASFLDNYNLLPFWFYKEDGFYSSVVITNVGSFKMDPGHHHLYEWGNCSLFMMVGQKEDRVIVEEGVQKVRKVLPIRITFDERIQDGLTAMEGLKTFIKVLENPEEFIED